MKFFSNIWKAIKSVALMAWKYRSTAMPVVEQIAEQIAAMTGNTWDDKAVKFLKEHGVFVPDNWNHAIVSGLVLDLAATKLGVGVSEEHGVVIGNTDARSIVNLIYGALFKGK